jgi:hypothetical protein
MGVAKRSSLKINPKQEPGPYEAIVRNVLDPKYGGSLEVELLKSTGPGNTAQATGQRVLAKYLYPFYGATSINAVSNNIGQKYSQQSYGMWFVPPDIGNIVMVIFVEGHINKAYWFGCVQQELMNFMVPGNAATSNLDKKLDGPPGTASSNSKLPVVEHNKIRWSTKTTSIANMVNLKKPVNEDLQTVLNTQGLVADETRGITTSSARREVPSSVFGISTPGPIDKNATSFTDLPHIRLGGSTFVMDDGDDKFVRKTKASEGPSDYYNKELAERGGELDVPHNELVRIKTRTGHQLLFHNSEDLIYIGNAKGTSWVELSSDGKVDVYAEDSISFHTKNDFNLTADRDITMEAGGNINIKASGQTTAEKDTKGKIQIESSSKTSLVVGEGTYITTTGNLEINTTGEHKLTAGGASNFKSGGDHIETAPNIHMNGPAASEAIQAVELPTHKLPGHEDSPILAQRSPQHEPWTQHENLNPVAFKSALTDRDKTETVKNDLELTPIPDTFKNART